ncbi:MAG: methylcrotonoyl-CoA carboxylase, partial [Deltaproteobacteria bacterium]
MDVIESRIDTSKEEYRANYEAMAEMVEELRAALRKAREERSKKAIKRNAELGKLTVQQRLDALLDRNTPWLEIAPRAALGMYD